MSRTRKLTAIIAIAVILLVACSAYAFTASNTVPDSSAGDGTSVVSGYTISNIAYTLNGTTPTNIDALTFDIDPVTAGTTKAKLDGNWYDCTNTAGSISCDTTSPQLTVLPVDSFEALVVQ
jgi:hypothetical protein